MSNADSKMNAMSISEQQLPHLLEKYWAGETSLEEEKWLQAYFQRTPSSDLPAETVAYFDYFNREKDNKLREEAASNIESALYRQAAPDKGRLIFLLPHLWKVAAAAAILITAWFAIPQWNNGFTHPIAAAKEDTFEDPEAAYEEVKAALMLVSNKMKKGTSVADKNLSKLKKASIFKTEDTVL